MHPWVQFVLSGVKIVLCVDMSYVEYIIVNERYFKQMEWLLFLINKI